MNSFSSSSKSSSSKDTDPKNSVTPNGYLKDRFNVSFVDCKCCCDASKEISRCQTGQLDFLRDVQDYVNTPEYRLNCRCMCGEDGPMKFGIHLTPANDLKWSSLPFDARIKTNLPFRDVRTDPSQSSPVEQWQLFAQFSRHSPYFCRFDWTECSIEASRWSVDLTSSSVYRRENVDLLMLLSFCYLIAGLGPFNPPLGLAVGCRMEVPGIGAWWNAFSSSVSTRPSSATSVSST